jgi:hypothetical protein
MVLDPGRQLIEDPQDPQHWWKVRRLLLRVVLKEIPIVHILVLRQFFLHFNSTKAVCFKNCVIIFRIYFSHLLVFNSPPLSFFLSSFSLPSPSLLSFLPSPSSFLLPAGSPSSAFLAFSLLVFPPWCLKYKVNQIHPPTEALTVLWLWGLLVCKVARKLAKNFFSHHAKTSSWMVFAESTNLYKESEKFDFLREKPNIFKTRPYCSHPVL